MFYKACSGANCNCERALLTPFAFVPVPTLLTELEATKTGCHISRSHHKYRVFFFFTGPPPKMSKYRKVNLGQVRCI